MEKKAINIYHVVNALHLIFYAFMGVQVLNIGNLAGLFRSNYKIILFGYISIVILLGIIAKSISKTTKNPIQTNIYSRYIHFSAIAVFVLGVTLSINISNQYVYLVFLSFPLDLVAFIIAFKSVKYVKEMNEDLLDEFEIEE